MTFIPIIIIMQIYNWYHSNVSGIPYVHGHRLQCYNYTWRIPLAFISPCCSPLSPLAPLLAPFYLLGTLLAVTGSVHLSLRLLVNWPPPVPTLCPNPPPSKFPEPQLPSASQRRPQVESGVFCPEQAGWPRHDSEDRTACKGLENVNLGEFFRKFNCQSLS